jgi:hypothetical protein
LKSFSEDDVASRKKELEKDEVNGNVDNGKNELVDSSYGHSVTFFIPGSVEGELLNVVNGSPSKEDVVNGSPSNEDVVNGVHHDTINAAHVNGKIDGEIASGTMQHGTSNTRMDFTLEKDVLKPTEQNGERDGDVDDFFDPQDSMSYTSNTDVEDTTAAECSMKLTAAIPVGEFYDAWEGTWVFMSYSILSVCFTLVDHLVIGKVIARFCPFVIFMHHTVWHLAFNLPYLSSIS